MARQIRIYDTTLRDGTQGEGVSFSMEDKVRLTQRLDALGVHYIEGGWPGSNPKDLRFFRRILDVPLKHARVAAFGATRRPGISAAADPSLQALVEARTPVATIFGKSWPFHVTHALQTTLPENLLMISDSVAFLVQRVEEVVYDAEHYFDGFKRDREYALETLRAAERAGASCLVLCDTNGGSLPSEVAEIVRETRRHVGIPLGIHAHNDGECAVANSLAAVLEGAEHVQGTLNGFGERCGNANLVSIIPNLTLKLGLDAIPELHLRELRDVARFAFELANRTPWQSQPFVGDSAFAHKAGMHVSAILKHPETYEHITPDRVGNHRRVLVSELAGKSNILWKAREYGIDLEKDTPETRRILDTLKRLEDEGYQFEGAEASFELLMERALGNHRAVLRPRGLPGDRRDAAGRPGAPRRGDGARPGQGNLRAHRGDRQRPRERARPRAPEGAGGVLPEPPGDAPRRLQGADPRRDQRHRGQDARADHLGRRRGDVGDGRRRLEHHRRVLAGPGRLGRVQAPPRRAPLPRVVRLAPGASALASRRGAAAPPRPDRALPRVCA